jgi:hypothetical protein
VNSIQIPRRVLLLDGFADFLSGYASKFRTIFGPEVTRMQL